MASYDDIKTNNCEIEYIPGGSAQNSLRVASVKFILF